MRASLAGAAAADKARWSFVAEPVRDRILAAVCDVLYIDEADLIDGDETDLRPRAGLRSVCSADGNVGVNQIELPSRLAANPSIAGWLRELEAVCTEFG